MSMNSGKGLNLLCGAGELRSAERMISAAEEISQLSAEDLFAREQLLFRRASYMLGCERRRLLRVLAEMEGLCLGRERAEHFI